MMKLTAQRSKIVCTPGGTNRLEIIRLEQAASH